MCQTFYFLLVIIFAENLQVIQSQQHCPDHEETINNKTIKWPFVEMFQTAFSNPPCIDKNNALVEGTCVNGKLQHNSCVSVQQYFEPECLPSHNYFEEYCIYISEPQRWSSDTPVFDIENILDDNFRYILQSYNFSITQFWLPVNRIEKYGKFVWTTPKKNLEKFAFYNDEHISKYKPDFVFRDCMIVDHISLEETEEIIYILKPEDCKKKHRMIHIYKPEKRYFIRNNAFSYSTVNNKAYFIVDTSCTVLAEPRTLEDNFLIKKLVGNRTCQIGIIRDINGTFRWASDNSILNYTDWIPEKQDYHNSVVVITEKGWELEYSSRINHSVCQIDHRNFQVELKLKPSRNRTQLTLTALSYQTTSKIVARTEGLEDINLKTMYTDISVDNDFSNVPNKYEKLDIRKLWHVGFNNSLSNYYYFNVLGLPDKQKLQTKKIFLTQYQQGQEYAFKVKIKRICDQISCDSQYKDNYKSISNYLYSQANPKLNGWEGYNISFNFRAVKIKEIKTNWDLTILFHIYVNSLIKSISLEYEFVKDLLEDMNKNINDLLVYRSEILIGIQEVRPDYTEDISHHKISIEYKDIKSCAGCLAESSSENNKTLQWEFTKIGHTHSTMKKCLRKGDLYFSRKCSGDHLEGAKWERPKIIFQHNNHRSALYPTKFCDIYENRLNLTVAQVMGKLSKLTTDNYNLKPLDIYYISEIFSNISETESIIQPEDKELVAKDASLLISNILTVDKTSLEELNQFTNTTNAFVAKVESFLTAITENNLDNNGVNKIVQKNFIHVNIDPFICNITGIALFSPNIEYNYPFTEYRLEVLTANTSVNYLLSRENLETAIYVPEKLLNDIKKKSEVNKVRIAINIFYNDTLFIENKTNIDKAQVLTKVYSVVIKGYDSDLYSYLPVISKLNKKIMTPQPCGFWDFGIEGKSAEWVYERNKDTQIYLDKNLQICYFKHLTIFAMLLGQQIEIGIPKQEKLNLEIVTAIGCLLSTIGICGIFLTALVFESWRHKIGSKIILNVCFCILLQIALLYLNLKYTETLCVITGTLLHYSVLCGFAWSLIMAVLQYLKFVRVIGAQTPHLLLKASIVGWILPIIPVVTAVGINYGIRGQYMPNLEEMGSNICYPQGRILYWTLLLPVILIVSTNLIMFFVILYNISCRPKLPNTCSDKKMFVQQLKLAIFLFFLLGLTWISGLITIFFSSVECLYLFSTTASLQGFVLFLFYIIMDQSTRGLWVKMMKPKDKPSRKISQSPTQHITQNLENKSDYSITKESVVSLSDAAQLNDKSQAVIKELEKNRKDARKRGTNT